MPTQKLYNDTGKLTIITISIYSLGQVHLDLLFQLVGDRLNSFVPIEDQGILNKLQECHFVHRTQVHSVHRIRLHSSGQTYKAITNVTRT